MAEIWGLLENTKYFQDLAARYFQEDYQGQRGYSDMGQLLRMAKRAGLERDNFGLDLNCGNGRPALFVIRRNRCRLIGLGFEPEALKIGQHRAERYGLENQVAFVAGSGATLPFAEATFDGVVSSEDFGLLPNFGQIYREAWRVLKPGGSFAFFQIVQAELASSQVVLELEQKLAGHKTWLEQAGFGEVKAFEVTGELRALLARTKRAYEERGVLSRLRDSFGPELTDQFYNEILRLYRHLENNQIQRWFFSGKKGKYEPD